MLLVAVQICQLLLNAKDAATRRAFAPHYFGIGTVYIVLASLYFKSRVPAPKDSLRRLSNLLARKGSYWEESRWPTQVFSNRKLSICAGTIRILRA
eukprot:5781055-Pleurochrysis_carterae.AAC.1